MGRIKKARKLIAKRLNKNPAIGSSFHDHLNEELEDPEFRKLYEKEQRRYENRARCHKAEAPEPSESREMYWDFDQHYYLEDGHPAMLND